MREYIVTTVLFFFVAIKSVSAQDLKHSVGVKPFNFSMIDLSKEGEFPGYHFGIEFEKKIAKSGKWTFVLPVTYANLKTILISDFYRSGFELYATPGLRFYPKGFNRIKGFSFGGHFLLGYHSSESSGWSNRFKTESNIQGLLINANYSLKLRGNTSVKFELGSGVRLVNEHKFSSYLNRNGPGRTEEITDKHLVGGIFNASVGFHYRF